MNELRITGDFSISEVHSWLHFCLPDVSDRVNTTEVTMCFKNSYTGTHLSCTYRKEDAIFRSESVATLSVVKQFVTKEATSRNVKISINLCKNNFSKLYYIYPL